MGKLIILLLFLLMVALFPGQGSAQVYKYVDKDGVVHFTDTPTDPRYQSYIAGESEKKESSGGIQPKKPAENHKPPAKENKKSDDLKDVYDLKDLDDPDQLPPFSYKP